MKKTMSLLVAMLILIANLVFPVSAATDTENEVQTGRDELIALACEVFPEYAEKITDGFHSAGVSGRSCTTRSLVTEFSREVEEGSTMHYAEYSGGVIVLTLAEEDRFPATGTITDVETDGQLTHICLNIHATCSVVSGDVVLRNIYFDYRRGGYDYFTSIGTCSNDGKSYIYDPPSVRMYETANSSASISYQIFWRIGASEADSIVSRLSVEVGNDRYDVFHVAEP